MIRRGFRIMRRLLKDPRGSSQEIARRLARRIERFAGSASAMAASRQPTADPIRVANMSLELYSLSSKLRLSDGLVYSLMGKLASSAQLQTQTSPATQDISMLYEEALRQVYSARAAECHLLTTIERDQKKLASIGSYLEQCRKALGKPGTQIAFAPQEISMLLDEALQQVYSTHTVESGLLATIGRKTKG